MNRRRWIQQSAAAAGLLFVPPVQANPLHRVQAGHGSEPIFLDSNENPYGPPQSALDAMQTALTEGNRYADERPLVEAIAVHVGLTPEHVVLGHGSFELLCTIPVALIEPGDEVMEADLTFGVLAVRAEARGAHVRRIPLTVAQAHDLGAMEAAVTPRTGLVYVCNPNNPTGTIVPDRDLRPFCERVSERAFVVVDEAYHEYVESPDYASVVDLVQQGQNVVVLRTFSKVFGLAGMRVGYALARPDVAARLRAVRVGGLAGPGLAAAQAALQDTAFVAHSRRRNAEARAILLEQLNALGLYAADSHASFVWTDIGRPLLPVSLSLAERDIFIGRPPNDQTPWARISLGTPEQMKRTVAALTPLLTA